MALRMDLWKVVNGKLEEFGTSKLHLEENLEDWIMKDSSILGMEVLLIGQQVITEYGGRIDLLGIDQQGELIIFELKRDRTPREVVAQVIDYATWVKNLTYNELNTICTENLGENLTTTFKNRFGESMPETVNSAHSMVIVASELDDSSERIVQYLADEHDININAIFFNFFKRNGLELLGRAWLMDPVELQERVERKQAPWLGWWFVNVGEGGGHRNWDDNRKYNYIGAGQGVRYARALERLKVGNTIFAYMKKAGDVGGKDFTPANQNKSLLELPLKAKLAGENSENPDLTEWAVGVKWLKTFDRKEGKTFTGVFANQNVVCKLRQPQTVEFLKREFGVE